MHGCTAHNCLRLTRFRLGRWHRVHDLTATLLDALTAARGCTGGWLVRAVTRKRLLVVATPREKLHQRVQDAVRERIPRAKRARVKDTDVFREWPRVGWPGPNKH